MKLKDLQEAFDTEISNIDYEGEFPRGYVPTENKETELGHGEFSRVEQDKNDPHVVDKHQINRDSRSGIFIDMFDQYAEIIAENRLWELIHFPRVYVIKKYKTKSGEIRSKWKMEKLLDLESLDREEIKRMSHRYFIPEVVEGIANLDEDKEHQYRPDNFTDAFYDTIINREWNNLKDETLKQATEKLTDIYIDLHLKYDDYVVLLDIHDGNIMARRTQNGLQVVFSDPFTGRPL